MSRVFASIQSPRPIVRHSHPVSDALHRNLATELIFVVTISGNRDSSDNIVISLRAGRPGFDSFAFVTASRTALGPRTPPVQWLVVALSPEVKRLGREADRSPPSSAEVKMRLYSVVLS
jgi:hypothetical protein